MSGTVTNVHSDIQGTLNEIEARANLGEWRALTVFAPVIVMAVASIVETVVVNFVEIHASNKHSLAKLQVADITFEVTKSDHGSSSFAAFRFLGDAVHGSAMLFAFGLVWVAGDLLARVKEAGALIHRNTPKATKHGAWLRAIAISLVVAYFISFSIDLVIALAPATSGYERPVLSTMLLVSNLSLIAAAYWYGTAGLKIVHVTVAELRKPL